MAPFVEAYFSGPQEWMIIGVIVLVLIGGAKIPQLAKGLGEAIREFKRNVQIRPDMYGDPRDDETRGESKRDALIVAMLLSIIAALLTIAFVI